MVHMKRTLAVLLTLFLLCTGVPFSFAKSVSIVGSGYCGAEGDGKNVFWRCDDEGTLTISGTGRMQNYNEFFRSDIMEPPWWDYLAQYDESGELEYYVKSIVVEEGVENIGDFSFYGSMATSVSLPRTLKEIGIGSFLMTCLKSVTIPASVEWIGVMAFGLIGGVAFGETGNNPYNVHPSVVVLSTDCVYQNTVRHRKPGTDEWVTENLGYQTLYSPLSKEDGTIIDENYLWIYGFAGSTTETYAETYGRTFVPLDTSDKLLVAEQSNISLKYRSFAFDPDVSLSVVQLDASPVAEFLDPFSRKTAWDISTLLHGERVQPVEPVTVSIPVPDGYNESSISVYHFDNQGEADKIEPVTVEAGKISYPASSFSVFVVVDESSTHIHTYTASEEIIKEATCTVAGTKRCYCSCDDFVEETIDPLNHDCISHDAKAPTCKESGWDAYETCSRCSYSTFKELPKIDHTDADNNGKCDTCGNQMTGGDHCKYCGQIHGGAFGWLVKIFHSILALFKR